MKNSKLVFLIIGLLGIVLVGIFVPAVLPRFDPTNYGSSLYDVPYCTADGIDLEMDLYFPKEGGPWAGLIFIHGGGWVEGGKAGVDASPMASGYLVASINYRMLPDHPFPAMIEDVKCAIRSLRAHARQYNLDPDRIALMGHSAGGHLAALAGLAGRSAGWDRGQYRGFSSRVQGIIVLAGPADLRSIYPNWVEGLIQNAFGGEQLETISPVTHASPDDPPFLIIHGNADGVVPVEQAYLLRNALEKVGVPVELVIVQHGGHGLEPVSQPTVPSGEEVYALSLGFLERILGR